MAGGASPERAIVSAVTEAVRSLEPTASIVADVSLRLEQSAALIEAPELYSEDLGDRREALLAHWDRLHELRSVSPAPRRPSRRALRLEVEADALGQLAVALIEAGSAADEAEDQDTLAPRIGSQTGLIDGRPATTSHPRQFAELAAMLAEMLRSRSRTAADLTVALAAPEEHVDGWLSGTELPSEARAKAVDDFLGAGGAIASCAAELRSAAPAAWDRALGGRPPSLIDLFGGVARALRGRLVRDAKGQPQGWPHDLRLRERGGPEDPPRVATSLATAFGLKAMMLIDDHLSPDLVPVIPHLQSQARPDGGYAATMQSRSRPEVTATVIDALYRVNATTSFKDELAGIKETIGDFERSRPYILTTVLEASLHLQPAGNLADSLIDDLLAIRQPYGDRRLWPEKVERTLASPRPSTVHTARAVHALALAQAVREPDRQVQAAIDQAVGWLVDEADLGNVGELIDRPAEPTVEQVYIRHFTSAWVAKALIAVGKPARHAAVGKAVAELWKSFHRPSALWCWDNGDIPIWMSFDGVEALKLAALARTIPTE